MGVYVRYSASSPRYNAVARLGVQGVEYLTPPAVLHAAVTGPYDRVVVSPSVVPDPNYPGGGVYYMPGALGTPYHALSTSYAGVGINLDESETLRIVLDGTDAQNTCNELGLYGPSTLALVDGATPSLFTGNSINVQGGAILRDSVTRWNVGYLKIEHGGWVKAGSQLGVHRVGYVLMQRHARFDMAGFWHVNGPGATFGYAFWMEDCNYLFAEALGPPTGGADLLTPALGYASGGPGVALLIENNGSFTAGGIQQFGSGRSRLGTGPGRVKCVNCPTQLRVDSGGVLVAVVDGTSAGIHSASFGGSLIVAGVNPGLESLWTYEADEASNVSYFPPGGPMLWRAGGRPPNTRAYTTDHLGNIRITDAAGSKKTGRIWVDEN